MLSFRALGAEKASEACRRCHGRDKSQSFWKGSTHELQEVSCTQCHAVHGGHERLLARSDQGSTCFTCHFNVRGDIMKRS
ncbi:MAG TPA: cytochrome c3 family protein, partial [Anaeromyxobacteraceae bacterium]|nr:cytochrome c3 family protein [Anaeromyxobacteraceae bacterium]